MGITLEPATYTCPVHKEIDLTKPVEDKVAFKLDTITFGGPLGGGPRNESFLVIVRCPGHKTGKQDGEPHDQEFSGEFTEV